MVPRLLMTRGAMNSFGYLEYRTLEVLKLCLQAILIHFRVVSLLPTIRYYDAQVQVVLDLK